MAKRRKKVKRKKKARKPKRAKKAKRSKAKKRRPKKRRVVRKTRRKTKTRAKKKGKKRKPNKAFMKPLTPSATLAAIVGAKKMPRTEVTKRIWKYIKRNRLQDKVKRTMINADVKFRKLFNGKKKVSMFELTKYVAKHLK